MESYLDNSATTRVFPEVVELMTKIMLEDFGNPSSMHLKGVEAEKYVLEATKRIAKTLKVQDKEIFFTSGGTESDNMAILGVVEANKRAGKHIITTKIEHAAVSNTMAYLEKEGYEVSYLSVDSMGRISLEELESLIRPDTILVSIMYVNNEVGSLQPISESGALIKKKNPNTVFHVDAIQAFGKVEILPKKSNIDVLAVSGHKIHGPKGVGFIYINEKIKIKPITYGGGQQKGMRSGTLNVPGIAGVGLAAKMITKDLQAEREQLFELKNFFFKEASKIDSVKINGCKMDENGEFLVKETAPHIMNISVDGLRSEVMLHALEERGVYVSAGSACSTHTKKVSSTLKSMGATPSMMDGALRVSMSMFTTKEELEYALKNLKEVIEIYGRFIRK